MFKKTRKELAEMAPLRWKKQYFKNGEWWGQNKQIYEMLLSLGDDPRPERVDVVIGNKSWTRIVCYECGKEINEVICIGRHLDFDNGHTELCIGCIKKALELIDK